MILRSPEIPSQCRMSNQLLSNSRMGLMMQGLFLLGRRLVRRRRPLKGPLPDHADVS